jgi:hypothetical protein
MNVSTDTDAESTGSVDIAAATQHGNAPVDAVATTVIEVGSIGQQSVGSHERYPVEADDVAGADYDLLDDVVVVEDDDDEVLIAPEYFDAGYVGSSDPSSRRTPTSRARRTRRS